MPTLDVLTPGPAGRKESAMDPQDYAALKIHALNGAQAQADGARLYAEDARRSFLNAQSQFTGTSSWAARNITGPHPQHGSPG